MIEVDGVVHEYQKYYDYQRDLILNELGLRVIRIKNEELSDIDVVKKRILDALK